MRLQRLDLLRYGPFTDKRLEFRPGATLHLVFGRNEAGKSSSLSAIGDLLFGFAKRREFDFLHEASTLRVGAEIVARDGSVLDFRRRRGNKKTLLAGDADEAPLHDDALAPFIGTLSREVFARAFGLNSQSLRDGGSAMLESEGELGATLFAAASGLTGLARIRRTLEAEADALFAPRASKERRFYQALERYDTAITRQRQQELKAGDWKALVAEITEIETQLAELKAQRAETTAALNWLRRLKQIAPLISTIDQIAQELEGLADLPELPEGFVARCGEALEASAGASGQMRAAEDEVTAAAAAFDAIVVDEGVVARAAEILDLFSRRGDYLSKFTDLPRIEAERDDFVATLADLSRRLGFAGPEDVVRRLPSDAVMEMARDLVAKGTELEAAIAADEVRLGEEVAALDLQEAEKPSGGIVDPKPWRDQLAALAPDLKLLGDRSFLETSQRTTAQKLTHTAARLTPQVHDIEQLAQAVLPTREAIATHKANFERILADRRAETMRLEANARQHAEAERNLAETEQSGPVAYEETIRVLRADRDASFAQLREQLLRTGKLLTAPELAELVVRYEEESAEADSIADQAIADAHRISRIAGYRDQIVEFDRQRPLIEARLEALDEAQTQAARAYGELFADADIIPVGPDAMVAWLTSVDDLMATRQDLLSLADEIAQLDKLGEEVRVALAAIADGIGLRDHEALAPLALSRLIGAALEDLTARWSERLSLEGARQAGRMRVGQIEDKLHVAQREHKAWRSKFETILPALGLERDASLQAAAAALKVWELVPDASRERANRAARVAGMLRDIEGFEESVFALGDELAPELDQMTAPGLIEALRERADAARLAMARREEAGVRLAAAETRLAEARDLLETSSAALNELAELLPEGSEPRAAVARLQRRDELRALQVARRREFNERSEGLAEADIRAQLVDFDPDRAELDAEDLERRSDSLHVENNRLYALLGQKQEQRQQFEAGTGSELPAFERLSAETEIMATARQWAVRKIAAALLGGAIDRHREAQSDPLLLRAGELFATLTLGSFAGLMQDYGEDDQPRLVGVRGNGEHVAIGGMSEGTRDQLYLALRLAYIEDYAGRTEPIPFIGDDIFQTFDDDRTASGLTAFASTSKLFQPILFTHHKSVVAIARRVIGDDLDYIEL